MTGWSHHEKVIIMPKQTFLNLPEDKRLWILDCAVDEFAEHGYSSASISRIVAAAKIAKGSFYQYFEDKEDLYGYVIDRTLVAHKIRVSDEESVKLTGITLTEFLRVLLKRLIREFTAKPKLLKISLDFARTQYDPVQKRISGKYQYISDNYFQNFIISEKSRNEIDAKVDDDILSLMLFGATNEIMKLILSKGHAALSDEYIDNWVDRLEYILTNGIFKNTAHENREKG